MDRARARRVRHGLLAGAAAAAITLAVGTGPATAEPGCDLIAATSGSDSNPGTVDQPLRTVQKLLSTLPAGATGCLRAGLYATDSDVKLATPRITLTSYPGERATVRARLWVSDAAPGSTVAALNLDGRNSRQLPSPTINGDRVTLAGNDITNHRTTICISVGSPDTWGRAQDTLIEGNRIHDCGAFPANNFDHGIYVNSADDTVIRGNWIYDNANRGIQLYPDAQRTLITGNVIDHNGQGVIFGGGEKTASSNNLVEYNVITNSRIRDNVESSWGGPIGRNNVARHNCVAGGAYDDGDGGILGGSNLGFTAKDNTKVVPRFADRDAGDFSVDPESACGRLLASGGSVNPLDVPTGGGNRSEPAVTIDTTRRKVRATTPVRVRGRARGTERVQIQVRRHGRWHRIGSDRTTATGRYNTRVRIHRPGKRRIKAVARGLRDSRRLALKIRKRRHH